MRSSSESTSIADNPAVTAERSRPVVSRWSSPVKDPTRSLEDTSTSTLRLPRRSSTRSVSSGSRTCTSATVFVPTSVSTLESAIGSGIWRLTGDHLYGCAATMAFGVEARVPFLDKEFLRISMGIDAKHKLHKKGETDSDGKPYMEKVSRHDICRKSQRR